MRNAYLFGKLEVGLYSRGFFFLEISVPYLDETLRRFSYLLEAEMRKSVEESRSQTKLAELVS